MQINSLPFSDKEDIALCRELGRSRTALVADSVKRHDNTHGRAYATVVQLEQRRKRVEISVTCRASALC